MNMIARVMKAIRKESVQLINGWAEVEAYWAEHPETRLENYHI